MGLNGGKTFFLPHTNGFIAKKETQFTLYFGVKSFPKTSVRVKCLTNSMSGWGMNILSKFQLSSSHSSGVLMF